MSLVIYLGRGVWDFVGRAEDDYQTNKMVSIQEIILGFLEKECYEIYNVTNNKVVSNEPMCDVVFDGLYCWPFTKAGDLAIQTCSNDVLKSTNQVRVLVFKINMYTFDFVLY